MTNGQESKDIAAQVRESMSRVLPPSEAIHFQVDERGITATSVGDKTWWRVPIIPNPWPQRMTALYELLAEIEGDLQDKRHLEVLLFPGEPVEAP